MSHCCRFEYLPLPCWEKIEIRGHPPIFEGSKDFYRKCGEVICVTFVGHGSILKVDRDMVVLSIASMPSESSITGRPLLIAFLKKIREKDLAILIPLRPKESGYLLSREGLCYYRCQAEKLPLVKEVVGSEAVTRGERVAGFLHPGNPPRFS